MNELLSTDILQKPTMPLLTGSQSYAQSFVECSCGIVFQPNEDCPNGKCFLCEDGKELKAKKQYVLEQIESIKNNGFFYCSNCGCKSVNKGISWIDSHITDEHIWCRMCQSAITKQRIEDWSDYNSERL